MQYVEYAHWFVLCEVDAVVGVLNLLETRGPGLHSFVVPKDKVLPPSPQNVCFCSPAWPRILHRPG